MDQKRHGLMIISSIIMMMLMGTVYAYSIFRTPIEEMYEIGTFLSGIPYMTSLFFYALAMMVTGRLMKPNRLRIIAIIGTTLVSLGWLISGLTESFIIFSFAYGVLIGIGVGMVYGIPIYMIQKLFPNRSGMMTGFVLLGFGMSPLITAPLAKILIDYLGLSSSFLILSGIFFVILFPLSFIFILNEYQDFKKIAPEQKTQERLKPFKRIYFLFVIATTIGLMMIGLSYQIGVTFYGFDATDVTISLSIFAILNGVARPLFGRLMDKKGFKFSAFISLSLIVIASLIGLFNQGEHLILFMLSFGLFWFNLGAWLAIVPATIKELYGTKQYARKYGVMFTAYGVGSVIGTLSSGFVMDLLGWTTYLYVMILCFVLISVFILIKTKTHFVK
jgi:MFS family permease